MQAEIIKWISWLDWGAYNYYNKFSIYLIHRFYKTLFLCLEKLLFEFYSWSSWSSRHQYKLWTCGQTFGRLSRLYTFEALFWDRHCNKLLSYTYYVCAAAGLKRFIIWFMTIIIPLYSLLLYILYRSVEHKRRFDLYLI